MRQIIRPALIGFLAMAAMVLSVPAPARLGHAWAAGAPGVAPGVPAGSMECRGRVVDAAGNPIGGADVSFYESPMDDYTGRLHRLWRKTQTDAQGAFSFSAEAADRPQSHYGLLLACKEGCAIGWAQWEDQEYLDCVIELAEPARLGGVVVDGADGAVSGPRKPLAGATVCLRLKGKVPDTRSPVFGYSTIPELTTLTDSGGRFSFASIPKGSTADILIVADGYATHLERREPVTANPSYTKLAFPSGTEDIRIRLIRESVVRGAVRDAETGKPVAGARVVGVPSQWSLFYGKATDTCPSDAVTDDSGVFSIRGLGAGTHDFRVVPWKESAGAWISPAVEVLLGEAAATEGVSLSAHAARLLEVEVWDTDTGRPLPGARVIVMSGTEPLIGWASGAGLARLALLPGDYELHDVYKPGYHYMRPRQAVRITSGAATKRLAPLRRWGRLEGVVRDDSGAPVSGAQLALYSGTRTEHLVASQDGGFAFESEADMRDSVACAAFLIARDEGRNLAGAAFLDISGNRGEVVIRPAATLTGRVVDGAGKPIVNHEVLLAMRHAGGRQFVNTRSATDRDGRFRLAAVPVGEKYTVVASGGRALNGAYYGNGSCECDLTGAVAGTHEVEPIVLPSAMLSIAGVVLMPDGTPAAEARVYCYGESQAFGIEDYVEPSEQGKFLIGNLVPGDAVIWAQSAVNGELYTAQATLQPGANNVRIVLQREQDPNR